MTDNIFQFLIYSVHGHECSSLVDIVLHCLLSSILIVKGGGGSAWRLDEKARY